MHKTISQHLAVEFRSNTQFIEHENLLDFSKIENGILIVFASWSAHAIFNCKETIQYLYNYDGQIIIIDTDCMTFDFQMKVLGAACQGWGEIFVIQNSKIIKNYLGKNCLFNFKLENQ